VTFVTFSYIFYNKFPLSDIWSKNIRSKRIYPNGNWSKIFVLTTFVQIVFVQVIFLLIFLSLAFVQIAFVQTEFAEMCISSNGICSNAINPLPVSSPRWQHWSQICFQLIFSIKSGDC
jgi:hypothetical protein